MLSQILPANSLIAEAEQLYQADDEKNISWTRNFWKAIEPFTDSVYVNHLDSDDGNDRVKKAYGANYAKLQAVKTKYDPENFFRLNNNILPS